MRVLVFLALLCIPSWLWLAVQVMALAFAESAAAQTQHPNAEGQRVA